MKNYKRVIAGAFALAMALSAASCGSKKEDKDSSSFEATNNVKVEDDENISAIPDGSATELLYLGEGDLNPTAGNPETSTELTLFQKRGGSIKYSATTHDERFDKLAAAITANKDVPDIFKYEWIAFPSQIVREMYQPIDSIVDFESDLWSPTKNVADQFVLKGEHYVAPVGYEASAMLCYDNSVIESEGLDDPYQLYLDGEWTWSAWENIMTDYVGNASDTERYGVNGFFKNHFVQQTGKRLVEYDADSNTFVNNLKDPDIEKAENMLYDMNKKGLILGGWIGSASDCFSQNCLFYAMGDWAYTGNSGPKEGDNWAIVPIPASDDNPQKITTSNMTAYMWVKGSDKADAVKCWFECNRVAKTDPKYAETNKEKFMENNPYWTEEMYNVRSDVISDDYMMIFDYIFGISNTLGDEKSFDGNQKLADYIYGAVASTDEDGNQPTWAQIREQYSATVDSEIKDMNKRLSELNQ
ncbi:extracellular solute-binding protein [Ruminococcus sp. 210702-SL.1.03]|uniref:extracellular solute-binding protein n=1 Tax=Ruminococcus sp. 210702-SL.1.03 TaxID=2883233 RepID=UPI001D095E77|nr:extracellular solute-binding protein [Ruminococcus sp. 210702-SL.1.03]MCB6616307.1 extracellular solute-binding protein [Ruminococcus sp. 210702-SL.1.03]